MQKKQKSYKIFYYILFATNILAVALVVLVVKDKAQEKKIKDFFGEDLNSLLLDNDVANFQNKISIDRENKLRKLNSSPKELKQIDEVTTTTTTRTKEDSQPPSDSKTRSS